MKDLTVDGINISELTDQQLFISLRNAGVDVGPITGSTRAVYERKLARILRGESYLDDPFENEFDENQCSLTDDRGWTSIIQVMHRRPVPSASSPHPIDGHSSPVYGQKRLDNNDSTSHNFRSIRNIEQPSSKCSQLVFLCFSMKTVVVVAILVVIILLYLNA